MTAEGSNLGDRLRYSQVIEASLISLGSGNASQAEDELNYAAQVMARAVGNLKAYERKVDFHHLQEHDKMKAMLTLNTIYALQSKVIRAQADHEREEQFAKGHGGGRVSNASPTRAAAGGVTSGLNPLLPARPYGGSATMTGAGQGGDTFIDTSAVSALSPGRSYQARY